MRRGDVPRSNVKLRSIAITAAFALLLSSLIAPRFNADLRAYQARQWLNVPCEIIVSHAQREPGDGRYRLDLRYRYDLGGQILRSGRLSFGPPITGNRAAVAAWTDRYPVGALTSCRVNPANPAEAVLDASFPTPWWQMVVAAGLILVIAITLTGLLERLLTKMSRADRSGREDCTKRDIRRH